MKWFTTAPPKDRPFLIKIRDPYIKYYIVEYNDIERYYIEAWGEQYATWDEDEIEAWTTFDELDRDFDNNKNK